MFTGIVKGLGRIAVIQQKAGEVRLSVEAEFEWGNSLELGESISVSGACLTVVEAKGRSFTADVSAETISRTAMRYYRVGDRVNLERALRLSDRLGGHLVTGHVDGLGLIQDRRQRDQSLVVTVGFEAALAPFIIEKGSVALDGVSLTVNQVTPRSLTVNLIPHTASVTTLSFKKAGDYVNVETDLIGKYVARLLGRDSDKSNIDLQFLAENGFL